VRNDGDTAKIQSASHSASVPARAATTEALG
jgi:hypothetical protein